MSQKRILCYGDSNTWGFLPGGAGRLCADQRWTGVCRRELGEGYTVVECGLNGRTTIYDNPNAARSRRAYARLERLRHYRSQWRRGWG